MKVPEHAKAKSGRRIVIGALIFLSVIEVLGQMPNRVNYTYIDRTYGETEISFVPIEHWRLIVNKRGSNVYVFVKIHRWIPGLLGNW